MRVSMPSLRQVAYVTGIFRLSRTKDQTCRPQCNFSRLWRSINVWRSSRELQICFFNFACNAQIDNRKRFLAPARTVSWQMKQNGKFPFSYESKTIHYRFAFAFLWLDAYVKNLESLPVLWICFPFFYHWKIFGEIFKEREKKQIDEQMSKPTGKLRSMCGTCFGLFSLLFPSIY